MGPDEPERREIAWAGGRYAGEMENGIPHGVGVLSLPDGTRYEGEWSEGKPHGHGMVVTPGSGSYNGEFYRGKRHGYGRYVHSDGRIQNGIWKQGHFAQPMQAVTVEPEGPSFKRRKDVIVINNLSFVYSNGKGVFDLTFSVSKGEVFGFLGPNGAGKTTAIRNLLGFTRPKRGECSIFGLDCRDDAAKIQHQLGYLPGEIAFFEEMSGTQFLDLVGEMRGLKKRSRRQLLLDRFELDPFPKIRRMSKGMKQKLGLVAAFMHDPAVYILDEPTSGLDPLMQSIFVEVILEEKERGKTILMSSHNFEETYRTCDRAGIIRDGRLVAVEDVHELKTSQRKAYLVTLSGPEEIEKLKKAGLELGRVSKNTVEVFVSGNYNEFIRVLAGIRILGLDVGTQSLEQIFMKYYGKGVATR